MVKGNYGWMKPIESSEQQFVMRRRKLLGLLESNIAIIPALPSHILGREIDRIFPQNSDFLYFTGFEEPDSFLVLSGAAKQSRTILYVRERNIDEEQWVGERLGLKRAEKKFQVDEVRDVTTFEKDLPQLLKGHHTVLYPFGVSPVLDAHIPNRILKSPHIRNETIYGIRDVRTLTAHLRAFKDKNELRLIRSAIDCTIGGFWDLFAHVQEFGTELHAARFLETAFAKYGATGIGFSTIVASGKNSTTLHYSPQLSNVWKKDILLIDAGASVRGYSADITRTIPVSGKFSSQQAALYEITYEALQAGIKKAKPGVTLDQIHQVTVQVITDGLIQEKLLKGTVSANIEAGNYKKFYMHRAGHFLGLDVHELDPIVDKDSDFIDARKIPLLPNQVFTIEPGVYCHPSLEKISSKYKGIGIRLEEDILVTSDGCEVLTEKLPVKLGEIEECLIKQK
jgi:Xaa-Pro aminopeptidase